MSEDLTRIRAGWLVDVAAGEVLRDRVITVRGDLIGSVDDDDGTPVELDLSDHTVLPGLIDCHAHLIGEIEGGHGYAALVQRTGAQEALTGVRNARDTVLAGFTSVRDVGTFRAFVDVALRDAIEAGDVLGPRMLCAGAYVTSSGGGGGSFKRGVEGGTGGGVAVQACPIRKPLVRYTRAEIDACRAKNLTRAR